MAISYTLNIAIPLAAEKVAAELYRVALEAGLLVESTDEAKLVDPGVVTASGTWLRVLAEAADARHPVSTALGFSPTIRVAFRFDKFADFDLQGNDMVELVAGLLGQIPGDLVLHFQFETIWLLRRGDELTISDRDDLWPPSRLALLKGAYDRRPLTFSDIPG
jgi:hypothetical protein